MLHLIAFPPSRTDLYRQVTSLLRPDDAVVLLEEGIYHLLTDSIPFQCDSRYAVLADLESRNIACPPDIFSPVSVDELVELTVRYDKTISWYS